MAAVLLTELTTIKLPLATETLLFARMGREKLKKDWNLPVEGLSLQSALPETATVRFLSIAEGVKAESLPAREKLEPALLLVNTLKSMENLSHFSEMAHLDEAVGETEAAWAVMLERVTIGLLRLLGTGLACVTLTRKT